MGEKKGMLTDNSTKIEELGRVLGTTTGSSSSDQTGGLAGLSIVPDFETHEKSVRRRFTAQYKRRILREEEARKEQGLLGALLLREGLYSSNLVTWRRQADHGT